VNFEPTEVSKFCFQRPATTTARRLIGWPVDPAVRSSDSITIWALGRRATTPAAASAAARRGTVAGSREAVQLDVADTNSSVSGSVTRPTSCMRRASRWNRWRRRGRGRGRSVSTSGWTSSAEAIAARLQSSADGTVGTDRVPIRLTVRGHRRTSTRGSAKTVSNENETFRMHWIVWLFCSLIASQVLIKTDLCELFADK